MSSGCCWSHALSTAPGIASGPENGTDPEHLASKLQLILVVSTNLAKVRHGPLLALPSFYQIFARNRVPVLD